MQEFQREPLEQRIGAALRALRESKHMSQAALAAEMTEHGFLWHQQTVGRVESGRQSLRAAELVTLAEVMQTSVDRFTWGSAEANETQFVYAARGKLASRYWTVVDAVTHLVAEGVIAERVAERHKGSGYQRVRDACDDVFATVEEYTLDAAIDEGIRRYEERVAAQARMDQAAEDDVHEEPES